MTKRIFLGLTVPNFIKENVAELQTEFSYLPIKWVPPQNLHITLVPPWKPENFNEDLILFKNLKISPPNEPLKFQKITHVKRGAFLRAEGDSPETIIELADILHQKLNRPKEKRDFQMHITIARKVSSELQLPDIELNWEFNPESVVMFESLQHKEGTDYKIIHELSFTDIISV